MVGRDIWKLGANLYPFAAAGIVFMGESEAATAIMRNPASWFWYVLGYGLGTVAVLYLWPLLAAPGLGLLVYQKNLIPGGAVTGILVFLLLEWAWISWFREPDFFEIRRNPAAMFNVYVTGAAVAAAGVLLARAAGSTSGVYWSLGIGSLAGAAMLTALPSRVRQLPLGSPSRTEPVAPASKPVRGNPRAFDSLVGVGEAVEAIKDAIELPLRHSHEMADYGLRPGKGLLLWGSPGTGKTSVAKSTAEYFGCPFYVVNASELIGPMVGAGEQALRRVFQAARANRPSVIFFDEIDAIGRKRDGQHLNRPSDLLLNLLLTEMDGFAPNDGVFVIAATNRPDVLDEALLRPGRFDRRIEIPLPDAPAREKLFRLYLSGKPLGEIEYAELARRTERLSPAEISAICSGAALRALKRKIAGGPAEIGMDDLLGGG